MLLEAYLKADQFLVDRANEAVKAWNWTTGRTRADLAKIINIAGWGGVVYHDIQSGRPENILLSVPALLIGNYIYSNIDEEESKKQGPVSIRSRHSRYPEFVSKCMSFFVPLGLIQEKYVLAASDFSITTAAYIMRADYQAPSKKNVFTMARDKLEELLKSREPIAQTI